MAFVRTIFVGVLISGPVIVFKDKETLTPDPRPRPLLSVVELNHDGLLFADDFEREDFFLIREDAAKRSGRERLTLLGADDHVSGFQSSALGCAPFDNSSD
jgi:hypothetical protein